MLTCIFEDGGKTNNLRHVVTGMIVRKGNQILLERRAQFLSCGGMIAIPGGYVDRDERVVEGAMREVMEETGYETKNPILFLVNDKPDRKQEDRQNVEFTFILEAGEQIGELDHETTEVFWCDLDTLPPKEEWAFDHYEEVQRYLEWLKKPEPLPIMEWNYS